MTRFLAILLLAGIWLAGFCPNLSAVADASAQTLAFGCESPTGTDSAQFGRLCGPGGVNADFWRCNFVTWSMIETSPACYDWRAMDKLVAACTVSNLPGIGWPGPVPKQPWLVWNITTPPPWATNSQSAFINYHTNLVKAALLRYRNVFAKLEPWNEPDGGCNWVPQCSNAVDNAQFVARDMAVTRTAARAVQPGVLIVGPSNTSINDRAWNVAFAQAGGGKSIDEFWAHDYRCNNGQGVALSPYDAPSLATDVKFVMQLFPGKPFYLSECGISPSLSNAIAYPVAAQRAGVKGIALVGIMGGGPLTYWDWNNNCLTTNGAAFLATMRALNR